VHLVTHFVVYRALLPGSCCLLATTCCRRLLHLLLLLALRKPGPRSLGFAGHPGEGSEQSVPWPVWSLFAARIRLVYTWPKSHLVQRPMGAMSGVTPTLAVRSGLSFLDSYQFPTSVEPFTPVLRDTPLRRPPAYATTMLAPKVMQESTLSHNEFALCLQLLLRPSSALSACEFATCMRALIPSPVPACLPSLPQPSLALSPREFESLYMRALTPTHVPAGFSGYVCISVYSHRVHVCVYIFTYIHTGFPFVCVCIHVYVRGVNILVRIYLRVCTQSLGGCVCGYVYSHRDCMCLCSYLYIGTQSSCMCWCKYICVHVHGVYMDVCTLNDSQCVYDNHCFYYHSWRNNVVIAFGTLSSFLT